jgi:hypothetical protein
VVDENSIITSDSGIARAAAQAGIEVLKITEGFIRLKGFSMVLSVERAAKSANIKLRFAEEFRIIRIIHLSKISGSQKN